MNTRTSALLAAVLCASVLVSTQHAPSIVSITVCSGPGANPSDGCADGASNTAQRVLAPDGGDINDYGGLATLADEHSTVFPPGALPFTSGYTFFVAARTNLNTNSSGVVVLGSNGPDPGSGQWTLDFAPGFGLYAPFNPAGSRNGQVFISPVLHRTCPSVTDPTLQDATFDLNYANPGSVLLDPTNPFDRGAGNLIMVYEGSNRCIGLTGGDNVDQNNSFYSDIAVATSFDFGHTWPAYRYDLDRFGLPKSPLPNQNPSFGPRRDFGATGRSVCAGDDCFLTQFFPLPNYGRYSVLHTPATVASAMQALGSAGGLLTQPMGDTVPAAFIDDIGYRFGDPRTVYVYEVGNYAVGDAVFGNPPLPGRARNSDLVMARGALNGGAAPLSFMKWSGDWASQPGNGGVGAPIFPAGDFTHCEAAGQLKTMGSISFVEATQQYLLTFVCISNKGNPANPIADPDNGAAWFWSTSTDLSHPETWSTPQQVVGTWKQFDPAATSCNDYDGWYPTIMSLGQKPGHLDLTGYVFYMKGCTGFGVGVPGGRQFSTRVFTISTN